jgi:hypothetical protein
MFLEGRILPPLGQWRKNHYAPESMCEAFTVIEIICSRPMMHMDTCIKIFEYTLAIFNECCTFLPLTDCHSWSLEYQCWAIPTLVTSGMHFWLALFGTVHFTDTDTGNIWKSHKLAHPQVQKQCDLVEWIFSILVSVNVGDFI